MTSTRPVTRATGSSAIPQLIFGDLWEYDPAPETADPRLKPKYDLFIGGKFVAPKSGKYFESINPATEENLAEIALANQADVDAAYQAAQRAFGAWSKLPGVEEAVVRRPPDGAAQIHLLQAAGLLWTARRAAGRAVNRLPMDPTWDTTGLRMELVR